MWGLQPEATVHLLTTFYDTGVVDDSLFTYQPMDFDVGLGFPAMAKLVLAAIVLLILWVAFVVGYIVVLVQGGAHLDSQVVQWRVPLIVIQALIGALMVVALFAWLAKKEDLGLEFAASGFLLSLVALQTLYFYLSQFSAITATLLQLAFLLVLLAYRRWYLRDH